MDVIERFLKYTQVYTKSDPGTDLVPSTPSQMAFAKQLSKELMLLGLQDVIVDKNGYVMATLNSNCDYHVPVIGFISHMDTSPDCRGKGVKPQIFKNYQGDDLIINKEENVVLSPHEFPELSNYVGDDIITASGKTLLGADDKAGIAEIISAMEYLLKHDEIKHGKIRIAFTPDEEIGKGADKFDVDLFGAKWAYTIDGGELGELEYENFNAASATVIFNGRNVHPGYAKHKMKNSIRMAHEFISLIPRHETPEHTEGYEGFYHLINFHGDVEKTTLNYIIRDHDRNKFDSRKKEMLHLVNKINNDYGNGSATVEIKDQYYNMFEKIYPDNMHIVELASLAMSKAKMEAKITPVRGGTDGSLLSYKGLPCPNIFTGGHNFHGRYEYIPVSSIKKAVEVIINICEIQAIKSCPK